MKAAYTILFTFLILLPARLFGQVCTNNLGDNIFFRRRLWKRTANILLPDPKIAPGYTYSTSVPPFDGSYVITNNTSWPGAFPTWLKIKDNSNDPYGYMMVVNASYHRVYFMNKRLQDYVKTHSMNFLPISSISSALRRPIPHPPECIFLLNGVVQIQYRSHTSI